MKVNDFFGLNKSPFSRNNDFLYKSKDYLEIDSRLEFFIGQNGLALFTGPHGIGKSKIINSLLNKQDKIIYVPRGDFSEFEFFKLIGEQLDVYTSHCHISKILLDIQSRISNYNSQDKNVILVIDDVDLASYQIMKAIKNLYECKTSLQHGISIILTGHSSFRSRCKEPRLAFIKDNIIVNYECIGLSINETKEYINYCLEVCGSNEKLIDDKYYPYIHQVTEGVPQAINQYMSNVLMVAYSIQSKTINNKILKSAYQEIQI